MSKARIVKFRLPSFLLCCGLALTACASFPEVDRAAPLLGDGTTPQLLPLSDLLAQAEGGRASDASRDVLAARAAGLRVRAQAMRGPVHDAATRARLAAAIAAHPIKIN